MRIGIDYRMISYHHTANRGMGRYTQQQLREVLKLDTLNEYVVICHADADTKHILPEIRAARNVSISRITYPGVDRDEDPRHPANVVRHTAEFMDWIYRQRLDLYHQTTPFLLHSLTYTHFDACPYIATMYDLIPLIFPDHYLPVGSEIRSLYMRAVNSLYSAQRLIAISQSAKVDTTTYLGIPARQIDIAYPIADPCFRVLPSATVWNSLATLKARLGIPEKFILSVTHFHHTKNLTALLQAYAWLSPILRREIPLVLTCQLLENEVRYVRDLCTSYGIAGEVILTNFVSEDEIVALYNAALVVVHPSLYEGFGLPVVEAQRCGAPVITTTTSSLPEVGGDAALLVDPHDFQGLSDAIAEVVANDALRAQMRERGLVHSGRFDPAQLGRATIESYRSVQHQAVVDEGAARPRIAIWTPLAPQESGIADYSAELISALNTESDIEIFVDDGFLPDAQLFSRYRIQHHSAFVRRQSQANFDAVIYQLGASFYHRYMQGAIREHPGIVVLHDLVWGQMLYADAVEKRDLAAFKRALLRLEGNEALREFERVERLPDAQKWSSREAFFGHRYFLKDIVAQSTAQIIHMDLAADLEARYPNTRTYWISQGVADPWQELPLGAVGPIRTGVNIRVKTFVVGIFGVIDTVKRVEKCIEAFALLAQERDDSLLLIVGEPPNGAYADELVRQVRALGIEDRVRFTGRVSRSEFDRYLLSCDVVLNLRYPSRKQMSATLMRAIGSGKPLVITDLPEWRYLPDAFCLKVAADAHEVAAIAAHLKLLARDAAIKQARGAAARAYYAHELTLQAMAGRYLQIVAQVRDLAGEVR